MAEANSTEHSNEDDDAINVELMLRVKKGDHDAFEKLVEKYQSLPMHIYTGATRE